MCASFNLSCFVQRNKVPYKDSPPEAKFVNVLGLLLVIFGALILWIATRTSWKRPSDQIVHSLHTDTGGEDNAKVGPALSELTEAESDRDVRRRSNKENQTD